MKRIFFNAANANRRKRQFPTRSFLLIASVCLASSTAAYASGPYASLFGGVVLPEDNPPQSVPGMPSYTGLSSGPIPVSIAVFDEYDFDPGYIAGGALGYAFQELGPGFVRLEGEVSFRTSKDDDAIFLFGASNLGRIEAITAFANATYNVRLWDGALTPYIGAGIGYGAVDGLLTSDGVNALDRGAETIVDSGAFAWQGIAGVSANFSDRFELYVETRYLSMSDIEANVFFAGEASFSNASGERRLTGNNIQQFPGEVSIRHLNVVAGIRIPF